VHVSQLSATTGRVRILVEGDLPSDYHLEVMLPSGSKNYRVPLQHSFIATFE